MEELNTMILGLINSAIGIAILLVMFSMGLHSTFGEAFVIWRKPGKLIRYVISVVILVPVVTYIGLTLIPNVPVEAKVGLLLLAGAAGNSLVPKLAEKLGADPKESSSVLITMALLTIISAPLVIALTLPADAVTVSGVDVAKTVLSGVIIPIMIGVAIRQWWVTAADLITEPITNIADKLLSVVVIIIILKDLDVILSLGLYTLLVFVGFAIVFLAIGHLIGGPRLVDRMELGMFTANRNGAIAMLVATAALPEALPAIVAYGVLLLIVTIAYMSLVGKKLIPTVGAPAEGTQPVTE